MPRKKDIFDPAYAVVMLGVLSNLLRKAAGLQELGGYLAQEVREITGARTVILLQCKHQAGDDEHEVIGVDPTRRRDLAESAEIARLAVACHDLDHTMLWPHDPPPSEVAPVLNELGCGITAGVPLRVGQVSVGALLALDLPDDRQRDLVVTMLDMLAGTAALVLRNSLLLEDQDGIIRQKTEQLRTSERRYRRFVEGTDNLVTQVDTKGNFTFVNHAAEDVFGLTPEECVGLSAFEFIHPDDRERTQRAFARWVRNKTPSAGFENRQVSRTGEVRDMLWTTNLQYDKDGELASIVSIARDITERKAHEDHIRRSRRFLQAVIDANPESMIVIDRDYNVMLANLAARKAAGEGADLTELKCYQLSHGEQAECNGLDHVCPMKQILRTKKPVVVKHEHVSPEGKTRVVELTAAPIFDDSGEVVQIVEAAKDVTDRIRAEEEQRRLEKQIQYTQKLESLGVLAGGIAHDFNNLLTAVLGNADLALREMSPASPGRENLQEIAAASRRAADLCKQMLAYSGKGRFVVEPIDLSEIVEEMAHMLEISISKKAVLKYKFVEDLPAFRADATQIRQIIMNLITNASEAIGDRSGIISITTGAVDCDRAYLTESYLDEELPEGLYVSLEVADTGCGMDAETRAKLFDPFFTTKFTGRGLGLAAVLGIVRGHRGAIKIYSEPGKGTTFKVLFPAVDAEPRSVADRKPPDREAWRGEGTVLLVDDEEAIRALGKRMLERAGFDVLTANDGRDAVELYREHGDQIVCVILDLTMPRMDGEEAFREMRRIRSDVCVIVSSGYNEQEVTQRFVGKGLAGFIQKPYKFNRLLDQVRQALAKPSADA